MNTHTLQNATQVDKNRQNRT